MKNSKRLFTLLSMVFALTCFHLSVAGQSAEDKYRISSGGDSVRWDVPVSNSSVTVTVSAPNGKVYSKQFKNGEAPVFALYDKKGTRLPDGQYNYELRLSPVLSPDMKKEMTAARDQGEDAVEEMEGRVRTLLPAAPLVQSGSFTVSRGTVIVSGAVEPSASQPTGKVGTLPRRNLPARPYVQTEAFIAQGEGMFIPARAVEAAARPFAHPAFPDVVTPDDAIIQGSLCVGLDCVNNETFNFDTIRLKENNTRLTFMDTSSSAGFPTRDWRLRANDSASGGASAFFIDDMGNSSTGAEAVSSTPFTLTASAPTNSIFVDSTGRLGLRTSTPVLDVHANTSNTPAIRLEQNNSGGFTGQTWDIAGNEANFFIRDVTGGSRLPFRIRPGAPTSSIDISASGNVGIGTASPTAGRMVVNQGGGIALALLSGSTTAGQFTGMQIGRTSADGSLGVATQAGEWASNSAAGDIVLRTESTATKLILSSGLGAGALAISNSNVGIGTTAPTDTLSVNGTASKPGGGSWSVFSDERLKVIKGRFDSGLRAVMQLQPVRYEYKRNNALALNSEGEHIGFGAQTLQKIIPEAVTANSKGYLLVNNDPILWTMLNAIKEQQKEIEQLRVQIQKLQSRPGQGRRLSRHK